MSQGSQLRPLKGLRFPHHTFSAVISTSEFAKQGEIDSYRCETQLCVFKLCKEQSACPLALSATPRKRRCHQRASVCTEEERREGLACHDERCVPVRENWFTAAHSLISSTVSSTAPRRRFEDSEAHSLRVRVGRQKPPSAGTVNGEGKWPIAIFAISCGSWRRVGN